MGKIYFFTDESAIAENQNQERAFGAQPDESNTEIYNLDNRFLVDEDAPVFAITKGLVIAIADSSNADLLNLALLPINSYTSGFPIKLFIYRGVKKESLIKSDETIAISDSTWSNNNILKVIKDLQDDINVKTGTPNQVAISNSLGYNFSSLPDTTFIEKIFFDDTDNFHPILVEAGCQIGKFFGDIVDAGIEVVIDKIGEEPKLSLLKIANHQFQIAKLVVDPSLSDKEKLILKFNNRYQKEKVLAYLDITAFYGATKNQNLRLAGVSNNDDFLLKFFNRKVVYIDIRDDRGFSYNHFFKLNDQLEVGFYSADSNITVPVYSDTNYYNGWPLLKLNGLSYNNDKKYFFIKIPILLGSPENLNFLTTYTAPVGIGKSKKIKRHSIMAVEDFSDKINVFLTEPIKLYNWKFSDSTLGSNYFLLKKSSIEGSGEKEFDSVVWNNFFSLKMNSIFNSNQMQDGEFSVYTYSSINSPLMVHSKSGEVYYPTMGIALDKSNVTFFAYKDDTVYKESKSSNTRIEALIGTGKFKRDFNSGDYQYNSGNSDQSVGFLNQLINDGKSLEFKLSKYSIEDPNNIGNQIDFINYSKSSESGYQRVIETLEAVSLSHEEYNTLIGIQNNPGVSDTVFFNQHSMFLKGKLYLSTMYSKFTLEQFKVSLGVVSVIEPEDNPVTYTDFIEYPTDILVDNQSIDVINIISKN